MSYVISSVRETGTITYHCSTTRHALDKVEDFRRCDYRDIVILTGDHCIPESQLISMADAERHHWPASCQTLTSA